MTPRSPSTRSTSSRELRAPPQRCATPSSGSAGTSFTSRTQQTPRNLMGFKDGTDNIRAEDTQAMNDFVWIQDGDGPAWMTGGSYLIARRIRILFDVWDATTLEDQQRVIGRDKLSGAPLGGESEYDPVDLQATAVNGELVIPAMRTFVSPARTPTRGSGSSDGVTPTAKPWNRGAARSMRVCSLLPSSAAPADSSSPSSSGWRPPTRSTSTRCTPPARSSRARPARSPAGFSGRSSRVGPGSDTGCSSFRSCLRLRWLASCPTRSAGRRERRAAFIPPGEVWRRGGCRQARGRGGVRCRPRQARLPAARVSPRRP